MRARMRCPEGARSGPFRHRNARLTYAPAAGMIDTLAVLSYLGLSLTAPSPAAAWYFIVLCVVFSPHRAKKRHTGTEHDRQAKVLILLPNAMTETVTTSATYDQIAAGYAAQAGRNDALAESRRRFAARLSAGARVLDIGCGPAQDTAGLRKLGLRAAGFDRSRGMLAQARPHQLPLLLGDMRHLPVRDGALDGLWVCASFLHIPKHDAPAVLAELRRVLRPGGVLFISIKRGLGQRWIAHGSGGQRFFVFYQEHELDVLLTSAGFTVREGWLDADHLGRPEPWIVRLAE